MYNVSVQMPDVSWSTVPGARSLGYDCRDKKKGEDTIPAKKVAETVHDSLVRQLVKMDMTGCYVVVRGEGMITTTEIGGENAEVQKREAV